MKMLILTQYFPPETGAPQNRLFELAVRLKKKGIDISILTAMPNYPQMVIHKNYAGKLYCFEEIEGLPVHRSYIFVKRSKSLLIRLTNYFSFVFSSLLVGLVKIEKQDYIFCESPPLFLGITAIILSKIKRAKLIFNVSDLWPESAEKLGLVRNKVLLKLTEKLEENIYKNSFLITGQTNGIVKNISDRLPAKKIYWLKNGINTGNFSENIFNSNWREENSFSLDDFLIYYGGIFGYAQGLEVILKAADILRNYSRIKFVLAGDGPEKEKLIILKNKIGLSNFFFINSLSKEEILPIISSINAAVVPLKKIDLFKSAIPSKILEILMLKKPIILGVEGEAKDLFITEGKSGLAFTPEDAEDLARKILILYESPELIDESGQNGYKYVKQNFNIQNIANEFYKLIVKI